MFLFTRERREEVIDMLRQKGYSIEQIEHACYQLSVFNDLEREKGQAKKSQALLKQMVAKLSIYTHILHRTLLAMLQSWNSGKCGRITPSNLATYKHVCQSFLSDANRLLGR